jgi:hypothetical protein
LNSACREREAELSAALAAHANSKTVIQNLVRKISVSSSCFSHLLFSLLLKLANAFLWTVVGI